MRANGKTILLDCGMYRGRRKESNEKNLRLPIPVEEIDSFVLSHAHIDHSGRLPFLVAQGYDKRIWATAATRDLCAYTLADSAHIQEVDRPSGGAAHSACTAPSTTRRVLAA